MMKFEIKILGCGAATPTLLRSPSAQLLDIHDKLFLLDCGEGTQLNLRKYRIKFQRINHMFISHLHGDHYLGLVGLLSSMHLLGRSNVLNIYGPPGLQEIIEINLRYSDTHLNFPIHFHVTQKQTKELLFEDKTLAVFSIPLKHRIHCTGFLFKEKPKKRKLIKAMVEEAKLSIEEMLALRNGQLVLRQDGSGLSPEDFTMPSPDPRSYAYCSDTVFDKSLADRIAGATVIYHESTFLSALKKRAKETFHSTAAQAAEIAKLAGAQQLILGHFSSRYTDLSGFKEEAETIFPSVTIANDGLSVEINEVRTSLSS